MGDDRRKTTYGRQQKGDIIRWEMTDGRQQMGDINRWEMTDGRQQMGDSRFVMGFGTVYVQYTEDGRWQNL